MRNSDTDMTSTKFDDLRIDGRRLVDTLTQMGRIGRTVEGGCDRQAFTDEDRAGRDLFVSWCVDAGCTIKVDSIGNIFARRGDSPADRPVVLSGSHLDTQPTGGQYDGVYGVLGALEVLRTLNDADFQFDTPFEVVVWSNEEGVRFSPSLLGSGVWARAIPLDVAYALRDSTGRSVREELERIGYLGSCVCEPTNIKACFELHIEQGPILEKERTQIGIVSGIQGTRWYDIHIIGKTCHAGATPMEDRHDPVRGLTNSLQRLYQLARATAPEVRMTFGSIRTEPGARNTVPARVIVTLDLRHPDLAAMAYLDREIRTIVAAECEALQLRHEIKDEATYEVVYFDKRCMATVQRAATKLGYSNMCLVSRAAHDSYYVSQVAPSAMIFIPCKDGISHNEEEYASPADLTAGCNVLLHAVLSKLLANK